MPTDKKISELPVSSGILPSDISVLVDSDTTEQFSFSQLLAFLTNNLPVGATITFGTSSIPSDTTGSNGDVYIKTDTGQFAQKLGGSWSVVYTITQGVIGSTIYYGSGAPSSSTGINGDTYIQTTGGIFYEKITSSWVAKFTMATGPTGPAGANGTNGTNGTNGLSILNGARNPINLSDGVDGDFWINTLTWFIFGPKVSGVWPSGVSLIGPSGTSGDTIITAITAGSTANPLTVSYNSTNYPSPKPLLLRGVDNTVDNNTQVQWFPTPISGMASYVVTGNDDGTGHFADSFTFYILP